MHTNPSMQGRIFLVTAHTGSQHGACIELHQWLTESVNSLAAVVGDGEATGLVTVVGDATGDGLIGLPT